MKGKHRILLWWGIGTARPWSRARSSAIRTNKSAELRVPRREGRHHHFSLDRPVQRGFVKAVCCVPDMIRSTEADHLWAQSRLVCDLQSAVTS